VAPVTTACGEPFPGDAEVGAMTVTPDPSPAVQDGFALLDALPLGALTAAPLPLTVPLGLTSGVVDALDPHPDAAAAMAAKTPHAASPLRMFINYSPRWRNACSLAETLKRGRAHARPNSGMTDNNVSMARLGRLFPRPASA
jgi:hypothetical protein